MNRAVVLVVGAGAIAAFAAGCSSSSPSSSTPATTSTAPSGSGAAASLKTATTSLGTFVTDGSGKTLYVFEADTGMTSTCYGACASAWPPETSTGTPTNSGLTASLLATTTRTDHTTQVTYNGHPLYHFAEDTAAGQTNGQGVDAFGGKWYVVSPSGTPITTTAPAPSGSSTSGGFGY